jgi:hydrogenase-4 component B
LALLCFTKAFGVVFLGTARCELPHSCKEVPFLQLMPMYILAVFILLIGVFPIAFINLLSQPVGLFTGSVVMVLNPAQVNAFNAIQPITLASWILILLVISIFIVRKLVMSQHKISEGSTWGCGYVAPTPKIQYTASSFVRTYSKLFAPFLSIGKHEEEIHGVFPSEGKYHTHPYDGIEKWLIDSPLKLNKSFMGRFLFLHNGKLQFYILYGVLFILAVLSLPIIYRNIYSFVEFLKQL